MDMNKKDLKRLSKSQLIKLLLKRDSVNKPIPPQRTGKWENLKPKPILQKSVNEDLILPPPEQFQDGTSLFQNQGLTDHFKRKMHEDHQNQLESLHFHRSLKSKRKST